jgi:hypothetical protein
MTHVAFSIAFVFVCGTAAAAPLVTYDQAMFAAEKTLDSLADAGYQNGFEALPLPERVTHPGSHGFPDATFDFIFAKDLKALQPAITRTTASDHCPVTRSFALN